MDLRDGMPRRCRSTARSRRPAASPGVDPRTVLYLGLLPNLLLSPHPDYVMTHRLTPLAPGRTQVECAWYFARRRRRRPGVRRGLLGPHQPAGLGAPASRCSAASRSPHFRPGPLAPNEDAVHQFVTTIARGYRARCRSDVVVGLTSRSDLGRGSAGTPIASAHL